VLGGVVEVAGGDVREGGGPSMLLPVAFEFGLHKRRIRLFERGREELVRGRERRLFTGGRMHDELSWMSER